MHTEKFEPITYSNEESKGVHTYIIASFFGLPAFGSIIFGLYIVSIDGTWWIMFLCMPIACVLGFFSYMFYPTKQKNLYRYELTDEGLYQQKQNVETDQDIESFMPFNKMNQVLIGLYVERISGVHSRVYFRYNALLIIRHNERYFFEKLLTADSLQEWIKRLENKVPSLHYIDEDLSEVLANEQIKKLDFSQTTGSTIDIVSKHVGIETFHNTISPWEPVGMEVKTTVQIKELKLPSTKKAENRTLWIILFYNLLFAIFVLSGTPVDEDNFIEMTGMILLGYFGVNLLIPCLLVFWRKFTKWYLPLLLTVAGLLGQSIGLLIMALFTDFLFIYDTIIILNLLTFILWICTMIAIKVIKLVLDFMYKQERY